MAKSMFSADFANKLWTLNYYYKYVFSIQIISFLFNETSKERHVTRTKSGENVGIVYHVF